MGLHRQSENTTNINCAQADERRHLFWVLYTIDKDFSLVIGNSPNLPLYDCDVPTPNRTFSDQTQRAQSAIMKENIYRLLYSASAKDKTQREQAVTQLENEMGDFVKKQNAVDQEEVNSGWRGKPFLKVEMEYICYHMRVMILRCSEDPTKRTRCLEAARNSIRQMKMIRIAKTTVGGHMVLRRYEPTYFRL